MKKIVVAMLFAAAGVFAQDNKVKFTAKIENRNSDTIKIASRTFKKAIPIKNGVFSDTFEVTEGFYQLNDGAETTTMYLKPGSDINLKLDAKMFDETLVYSGKGSAESNVMAAFSLGQEQLEPVMEKGDLAAVKAAYAKFSEGINAKLADKEISETFKTQLLMGMKQGEAQMEQMFAAKAAQAKLEGSQSPLFEYENHKGGKTKLSDLYKGKYVYIDTWATWCGPCRQEIPFLQKVEEKYHGKKIEFVSISIDEKKDYEKWKKFVVEKKLGGVQLYADADWRSEWVQAFGINSIPRFILIGPDGKVVDADAFRPSDPQLTAQLDQLLK
ncbi:MAG: TlpA family protein disulfide reductase [Flavobacterium sp.]|uniref:TlpA family protein disulfide reductase n=1 Tax=Flavobacterium sp. TaxID=239 RepID=UPI00121FECE9|nr:TlpA disulfide reductase family protein [Flavobacterium sp.]RZJ68738.1 MAG: TlpA family protein disulfide reductase [Flavobacterium sp.]